MPKNELYIYDTIGEGLFESGVTDRAVADELKAMDKAEPIHAYINSFGGSVKHGMAIYTLLSQWPAGVRVRVDGLAASIASVIAMAGESIDMARGSRMMIHRPYTIAEGTADDMRKVADVLDMAQGELESIYSHRSGQSADSIRGMLEAETWMTGPQAVEMGFATGVLEEIDAVACAIPKAMGFKHAPQEPVEPTTRWQNSIAAKEQQLRLYRQLV